MGRLATAVAMTLALGPLGARAEAAGAVAAGSRVRVAAPSLEPAPVVGTVHAVRADGLRVKLDGRDWAMEVPMASVTQMWVSRGTRSRAALGAVLGAVAGAAAGYALFDGESADPEEGDGRALSVVFGAAGGAVAGGLLGSTIRRESWQPVDLSAFRRSALPVSPLRVTVRF